MSEIDPVDSRRFPPWRQQTGSGVSERLPVCQTCFLDGLWLFEVGQIKYSQFPRWRQRTGSSFSERFPVLRASFLD